MSISEEKNKKKKFKRFVRVFAFGCVVLIVALAVKDFLLMDTDHLNELGLLKAVRPEDMAKAVFSAKISLAVAYAAGAICFYFATLCRCKGFFAWMILGSMWMYAAIPICRRGEYAISMLEIVILIASVVTITTLYFIGSLHQESFEYDSIGIETSTIVDAKENKSEMLPGKDWDIYSIEFNPEIIEEMENDVIKQLEFLANDVSRMDESWLFRDGGLAPVTDEADTAMRAFEARMKKSESWILKVAAKYVTLCKTNMWHVVAAVAIEKQTPVESLSDDLKEIMLEAVATKKPTPRWPFKCLSDNLTDSGVRKAANEKENKLLDVIEKFNKAYLQVQDNGLKEFRS